MASIRKHVTREVVTLEGVAPVRDAATLMAERKIGSVAVREDGEVTGLVTERDLVVAVLARGGDATMPIREAMRQGMPRVSAGATETECAALMRDHATRHLLVEDEGRFAGLISMRDIIQIMLDEKQFLIDQLQTYITGESIGADPKGSGYPL